MKWAALTNDRFRYLGHVPSVSVCRKCQRLVISSHAPQHGDGSEVNLASPLRRVGKTRASAAGNYRFERTTSPLSDSLLCHLLPRRGGGGGLSLAALLCGCGWRRCEGWASSGEEGWAHRRPRLPRTIKAYLCRWLLPLFHRPLLSSCHQREDSSGGRCSASWRMWGTGFQSKAADLFWNHFFFTF